MKQIAFAVLLLILVSSALAYDITVLSACTGNCTSGCGNCYNLTCFKCQLGYTLNQGSNTCAQNTCPIDNCSACNSNGTICLKCTNIYSYFNPATSSCILGCTLSNCQKCVAGSSSCSICNTGYSLYSLTNQCIDVVISNCLVMHDFRNQEYRCTLCATGYKPSKDLIQCIENTCTNLNNCLTCANLLKCDQCRVGYSSVNGSCVANTCNVTNCLYCDNIGVCLRCLSSYILSGGQCTVKPCSISNCAICKPGSMYCDSCASGLSLNIWTKACEQQQLLKSQPINCQVVQTFPKTGLFSCVKCLPGYSFATQNQIACISTISTCPSNCLNCSSSTVCVTCNIGYHVQNGSCKKYQCANDSICNLCNQFSMCIQCKDPYSQYNYASSNCVQFCALPNCLRCKSGSNTCELCASNYAIYSWNGSCVYSVIKNCLVLHDWRFHQFQCTKCASGYKPSQDQTQCILGYCPTLKDCQVCIKPTVCTLCRIGYSFEKNECVRNKCNVANCLYCNQQGVCLRATSNFTVLGQGKVEASACKLANCDSCKLNSMFCDTCAKGYAYGIWSKSCQIDPSANTSSHGPNLKYLWLLSIGVVIIVAVILLIWVYQKGKNIDNSNRIAPKIQDDASPNTNMQHEKDTYDLYQDNIQDNIQGSPKPKGPIKLPPIRKVQLMSPSEDMFETTPKPDIVRDFT